MRCEWKRIRVGDLGTIITGKTPPTKKAEYWGGNIHFITPKDLQGTKHVLQTDRFITGMGLESVRGCKLPSDAVCVSCIGNIGYVAMTRQTCISNQQINSIIANENYDPDFVYYLMKSLWPFFKNYEGQSTTLSILNKTQFSKIEIVTPDLPEQKKIASILSSLDDKIELNNKINENLERQAEAIFKAWFIAFEPWNGKKPCEWVDAPLGSFVEIKRGGSPRPIQDFLSDTGLRWLKISDVTSLTSPYILDIKEHIKLEGLRKTVHLNAGELVLSNSATPGIPKILDVDSCIHDGWLYFPKSQLSKYWLYLFFKHIRQELILLGNGSIFTNLKTDILKAFPVTKADEKTLYAFEKLIKPLFETMLNADRESKRLTALRDALLPKLMSGEIQIL